MARITVFYCSADWPRSAVGPRTRAYAFRQPPRWTSDCSEDTWPGPSPPRRLGPPSHFPAPVASRGPYRPRPSVVAPPVRLVRCAPADRVSSATRPSSFAASRWPVSLLFGSTRRNRKKKNPLKPMCVETKMDRLEITSRVFNSENPNRNYFKFSF